MKSLAPSTDAVANIVKDVAPGVDALRFTQNQVLTGKDIAAMQAQLDAYVAGRSEEGSSRRRLVIDLGQTVTGEPVLLNSAALQVFLGINTRLKGLAPIGTQPLLLKGPDEDLREVLRSTRIDRVLPIVASIENPVPIARPVSAGR